MIKLRKLTNFFLLIMLITLSSCGIQDAPLDNQVFSISNLEGSCKLDTKKLNKILEENVSQEIDCLRSSLNQYTKYVLRSDLRYIQKNELAEFVTKFFPDNGNDTAKSLDLLFEFNSLFQNDPKDKISIFKLKNIFHILHLVNSNGQKIYKLLNNINQSNHIATLSQVKREIKYFLYDFFSFTSNNSQYTINLNEIFTKLKIAKKFKKYLFIKPLLLGGTKKEIKLNEMKYLFNNLSMIINSSYSLYFQVKQYDSSSDTSSEKLFKTCVQVVKNIQKTIVPQEANYKLITMRDLFELIEQFLKDSDIQSTIDFNKIYPAVVRLKSKLLNSPNENFLYQDLDLLLSWSKELTSSIYFNAVTYRHNKNILSKNEIAKNLQYSYLESYNILNKNELKEYWAKFTYIIEQYKYFSKKGEYNYYDLNYHRSLYGLNKISFFKFFISKAITAYGEYTSKNTIEISKVGVGDFFYDGEELMRELGMWPSDFDKLVDKIVMGSDLFQHNSDGNTYSNVDELTEFVTTLMNASVIKNNLEKELVKYCEPIIDDQQEIRYELSCYRQYFFPIFFDKLNMNKYYPRLYTFYSQNSKEHLNDYLYNIEIYSRDNPKQSQPINRDELMRLINAISNVESAFYRFDFNHDTIITFDEMDITFLRFNQFLRDQDPGLFSMSNKFVKNVLIFMLKKMQMPSSVQALWFHLMGKKKNIKATRFNISAILRFVTERGYP